MPETPRGPGGRVGVVGLGGSCGVVTVEASVGVTGVIVFRVDGDSRGFLVGAGRFLRRGITTSTVNPGVGLVRYGFLAFRPWDGKLA